MDREINPEWLKEIRSRFPVLSRTVNGKPLVYLDNAATTQKPQSVIDALSDYYSGYNANIHRGIHHLAEKATAAFESARDRVQAFLGAAHREEIIFTRGATEGINLVARTWAEVHIGEGDEILVSEMEHHSNIVPWQLVCERKKARLVPIPILDDGQINREAYAALLSPRVRLVAITQASNALGTINPVKEMIAQAKEVGAHVLVDGAQSAVHMPINLVDMGCDFFVCSAHKLYGPTGLGILYGRREILEQMPVFHGGGEMIEEVRWEGSTYNQLPYKFEAGTPNIADVIAFVPALDLMEELGKETISAYEEKLGEYARERLSTIPGLRIMGTAPQRTSVVSFVVEGVHPQDLGLLMDQQGVALRTGHHCTQPLMKRLGVVGTVRASFAVYNTLQEVDALEKALEKALKMLK